MHEDTWKRKNDSVSARVGEAASFWDRGRPGRRRGLMEGHARNRFVPALLAMAGPADFVPEPGRPHVRTSH